MNFDLNDEQVALRDLARQIIGDIASVEHVKDVEQSGDFDRATWSALAAADLLGLCLPEHLGGSGYGMVELALLLEEQGRSVTPIPLLATMSAAFAVAEAASTGVAASVLEGVGSATTVLTSALSEWGANDVLHPTTTATALPGEDTYAIAGEKPSVPYLQHAAYVIVPVVVAGTTGPDEPRVALAIVPTTAEGVSMTVIETTNREPAAHLALNNVVVPAAHIIGEATSLRSLLDHTLAGLAAMQVGVAETAMRMTAAYVADRQQFGKPLSSFQAVTQRAADAYITTEAMRVTALNAAWHLAEHVDARQAVMVAAYWADRGAQDVVLAAQHLHGGIGSDVDYPVHRYFLWGSQLASSLGGESSHLARLGHLIAMGTGV